MNVSVYSMRTNQPARPAGPSSSLRPVSSALCEIEFLSRKLHRSKNEHAWQWPKVILTAHKSLMSHIHRQPHVASWFIVCSRSCASRWSAPRHMNTFVQYCYFEWTVRHAGAARFLPPATPPDFHRFPLLVVVSLMIGCHWSVLFQSHLQTFGNVGSRLMKFLHDTSTVLAVTSFAFVVPQMARYALHSWFVGILWSSDCFEN